MFVSVEGDWGAGKSTAIRIISEALKSQDNIDCVRLNMWPYAGMERGADVVPALLQDFCNELQEVGIVEKTRTEKMLSCVKRYGTSILSLGLNLQFATDTTDQIDQLLGQSPASRVREFGTELEEAIRAKRWALRLSQRGEMSEYKDYRLITIIDDLDRLNPLVAVEVLEAFKNFADRDGCVFLISVDLDVVSRGTKMKYGDWFDQNRAQRFFDKVFQLRFHLPVNDFDTDEYIRALLGKEEVDEEAHRFAVAAQELLGDNYGNPRNIKRAFNLLNLYKKLETIEGSESKLDSFTLFSSLLIQIYRPDLYKELTFNADSSESLAKFIAGFKDSEDGVAEYLGNVDAIFDLGIFDSVKSDGKDTQKLNMDSVNWENLNRFVTCLKNTAKLAEPKEPAKATVGEHTRRKQFTFTELGIKPGEKLQYALDSEIVATVHDDKRIVFDGQVMSLTKAAQIVRGTNCPLQGPLYWRYNGELLTTLRDRLYEDGADDK